MKPIELRIFLAAVLSLSGWGGAGCKTVARETIISSINTGIGISLTQNPRSDMYEVKLGYIRSQYYSVPTGKNVEQPGTNEVQLAHHADITPEVLSGIRVESSARDLFLGANITESFAVGSYAVMSPAAVAMYVSQAKDAARADAAASATGLLPVNDARLLDQQRVLDGLLLRKLRPNLTMEGKAFRESETRQLAEWLAEKQGKTLKSLRRAGGKDLDELIARLRNVTVD